MVFTQYTPPPKELNPLNHFKLDPPPPFLPLISLRAVHGLHGPYFPPRLTDLPDQLLQCHATGSNVYRVFKKTMRTSLGFSSRTHDCAPSDACLVQEGDFYGGDSKLKTHTALGSYSRAMPRLGA